MSSTSRTEARMVWAAVEGDLRRRWPARSSAPAEAAAPCTRSMIVDDVRAGLAADDHQHGARLPSAQAGDAVVLDAVDDGGDVAEPHRRAVAVGDDERAGTRRRGRAGRWRRWRAPARRRRARPWGWSTVAGASAARTSSRPSPSAGERPPGPPGRAPPAAGRRRRRPGPRPRPARSSGPGRCWRRRRPGPAGSVSEVSDRMRMGASAGFTLR